MKRALVAVGLAALYCWWTYHETKRHILGGQKCCTCGAAFSDLEDAGTLPDGRVTRTRSYARANGSLEQSPWWRGQ